MTGMVHIAGHTVTIGSQIRQRCAWCGAVLIDEDLSRVAVPIEDAGRPFPTWPTGELVEVERVGIMRATRLVDHTDGDQLPDNACGRLPHEVTGTEG